jgi:hypothetical protein
MAEQLLHEQLRETNKYKEMGAEDRSLRGPMDGHSWCDE